MPRDAARADVPPRPVLTTAAVRLTVAAMTQRVSFSSSGGIHIGRLRGVDIQVHWLLIVLALWQLHNYIGLADGDTRRGVIFWLMEFVALFVTILLHVFGHVFAARRVGGWAQEIILWPLGGLAYCEAPHRPGPQFAVAAGGPAVNLLIFGVTLGVFELLPENLVGEALGTLRFTLVHWNLVLLVFNVLPVYPLDGGRMFQALVWGILARRRTLGAYGRSVAATVWAARITAGAGVLLVVTDRFALPVDPVFTVIILLWCWYTTEQLRR